MTQTSPKPALQTATNGSGGMPPTTDGSLEDILVTKSLQPEEKQEGTRRRRGLSLRAKATAVAIALGILPVLTIGLIAYKSADESIVQQIQRRQQDRATEVADKVNRFMFERYADIQIISSLQILRDPQLRDATTLAEKQAALNRFLDAYMVYDSVAVFDLSGNVNVASLGKPLSNPSKRNYFQQAVKTGNPVISSPVKSDSTEEIVIYLAAPVKDQVTGKTVAVAQTRMPMSRLEDVVEKFGDSRDHFFLSDASQKIFLASHKNELGKNIREILPGFEQLEASKKPGSTKMLDRVSNEELLVGYSPLEKLAGLPELNWNTTVGTETKTAFEPQRRLLLTLATGSWIAALLISVIAAYLANRATRPILAAADTVEKLGQGKLDTRIAIEGGDELAVLGSNINLMASQLQTLLQEQKAETQRAASLLEQIQGSAKRLREQNTTLVELSRNKALGSGNLSAAFQKITEATTQTLEAERTSVWLYNSDRSGIRCIDLYEQSKNHHSAEIELLKTSFPTYFKALEEDQSIVAHDAQTDPRTHEFTASYLSPLGITSRMDAQIRLGDQIVGVVCCEHVGSSRRWTLEELSFISSIADSAALAMEAHERKRAEEELKKSEERQRQEKQALQRRAMELLLEVDPISSGNLTVRASVTEDEIGTVADSYNATVASLRKIVTQVQSAATQVAATTSSNGVAVSELSKEALRQAQEIAVALERIQEMSNSIRSVAKSAQQAEVAVQQATETVEAGDAAMNRTVAGILTIRDTVAETSQKVRRLGESSQNISKVVNLIGTFTAQTNLIALKASIEAARAGEEGRGFAVLADEVRSLARQSAQATDEIESLVAAIQTETSEVAAAMEAGSMQVAEGTKLVDETRQSLNKINAVSTQISALVEAIAAAAVMQSQTSEEVTQTISDVAAIANQNSAEAELVSASFQELLAVATELQTSTSQFKVS